MSNQRSMIAMTNEEVKSFIASERRLVAATIGPGGRPHVVPLWYGVIEDQIVFSTYAKSQKVLNLRRSPLMTGLIESGETYETIRGIELQGYGRIVDDYPRVLEISTVVSSRRKGADTASQRRMQLEDQARKRVGVILELERTVSWDHAKLQRD